MMVGLFCGTIGGRLRPLYRGRFLGSLATRYVGHSSSACKGLGKWGRQTNVERIPKDLSAKGLSYKGTFNQASDVNGTETQTTTKSSSSPLPVLPAKLWNRGDFDPVKEQYRQYKINY